MPTTRTRKRRIFQGLTSLECAYVTNDEAYLQPDDMVEWGWVKGGFLGPKWRNLADIWTEFKRQCLSEWIKKNPGVRPWAWWDMEAKEPRQQVGGSGEPDTDSALDCGIYSEWLDVDPSDLPKVEGEAAYLKRHGLLSKPERAGLTDADFEPEELDRDFLGIFDED